MKRPSVTPAASAIAMLAQSSASDENIPRAISPRAVPEGLEDVARRRQKYRVRYLQVHGGELPRGERENRGAGYRGALGRSLAPAQHVSGVEALYQR